MSIDTCFKPLGPTTLVVNAALQVIPPGTNAATATYRIRNLSGSVQYLAWGSANVTVTAPSAGVPQYGTVGMLGNSVETFEIPPGVYFIASTATGFEVTPGQGP